MAEREHHYCCTHEDKQRCSAEEDERERSTGEKTWQLRVAGGAEREPRRTPRRGGERVRGEGERGWGCENGNGGNEGGCWWRLGGGRCGRRREGWVESEGHCFLCLSVGSAED